MTEITTEQKLAIAENRVRYLRFFAILVSGAKLDPGTVMVHLKNISGEVTTDRQVEEMKMRSELSLKVPGLDHLL